MLRAIARGSLSVLVVAAFVLLAASPARAASFEVSPVAVSLSAATATGIVNVTNMSKDPVRLQVTGFAWGQGPDGEIQLTPTEEITFFPALVTLKPGEARKVRIGAKAAPGPLEKTYRILIEELPGTSALKPGEVQVRTRMGIPIFLEPVSGGAPVVRIEGILVRGPSMTFTVRNGGTVHFVASKMTVVGHTKNGDKTFSVDKAGWYVLAGGIRNYAVDLPSGACSLLRLADILIQLNDGTVVRSLANPVDCSVN